jgi:hypothetical protein
MRNKPINFNIEWVAVVPSHESKKTRQASQVEAQRKEEKARQGKARQNQN